jgi:ubiquinone biosynthesis protein COQ9
MTQSPEDRAINAFMDAIAARGWIAVSLADVARDVGSDVATLASHFQSRFDLLEAFGRRTDMHALRDADEAGGSQAIRDRLFALLMARFDTLLPHRAAVRALAQASMRDPALALFFARGVRRSMALMAECAGVQTAGLMGAARVKTLAALYLNVVRTWFADDSDDMAKTMKALDEALTRAERWEQRLGNPFGRKSQSAPVAGAA